MNIQALSFSQESFLIIRKELIKLREENALLKEKLAKIENYWRGFEKEFCQGDGFGVGSDNGVAISFQGLKELLAKRERQLLQAGNDSFLKDCLIDDQYEQIELLKKENSSLKQILEKLQLSNQYDSIPKKSKIQQFLMSQQIQSLPYEFHSYENSAEQQNSPKKRKLLRKNRIQFDIDSINSTQTSDQFISN